MLLLRITVLREKWDITYNGFQENTHPTASGPPRSSGDLRSRERLFVNRQQSFAKSGTDARSPSVPYSKCYGMTMSDDYAILL